MLSRLMRRGTGATDAGPVAAVGAVPAGRAGGARAVVGWLAIGLEAKLPYGAGWPIIPVDGGATVIGAG